ncbi:hypothetical protein MMC13_003151 [Lambiella insularis]|nr:hypothetical protein [Lambiella insularis]
MNTAVQDERTDIAQACGGFVDLLEESAYIEDELKLLWKERLLMGDEDAALALILSLLLNLRSLSTARDDCELPLTQHMIERIAKLDFTNEEAKPLGLLSRVSIKSNKNRDHPHDYHLLAALSRLPSLRTFAGTMRMSCLQCTNLMVSPVAEHIINEYRNPLFDPLSSNIDEIDLRNCNIGVPSIPGHSFVEFANCFRQLRKVRVVGCKFLESGSFKYLLTVLQPRGMHHLEELTFDLDGRTGEHTFDLLPTFRVLKTICVVFRPFAPLRELAVLINVLPQSLEVFGVDFQLREGAGVLSDSEEEQLRKKMYRLKLLADRKHDHTPNLHTFMVPDHVHETAMPKTAIKALSRAGIAVVCTGESSV